MKTPLIGSCWLVLSLAAFGGFDQPVVESLEVRESYARGGDPSAQRRPISSRFDAHHMRAQFLRNFNRTIRRTVVRYYYFTWKSCSLKSAYRFRNANAY